VALLSSAKKHQNEESCDAIRARISKGRLSPLGKTAKRIKKPQQKSARKF
jgi:hypothetical protein